MGNMTTASNRMMESSQSSSSSSSRTSEKSNFNYPLGLNMGSSWESGWSPAFNSEVKEDDSHMKISLDTSQYKPEDLKVSVNNGIVTVHGNYEEKDDSGSKIVMRRFSKTFTLPARVKEEEISSSLSSDGVLTITAPKQNLA